MIETLSWFSQTSAVLPAHDDWLSQDEKKILAGLRFPKRRHDWRLGRWTAKNAVRLFLSQDLTFLPLLEIRVAEDGAPEVFRNGKRAGVSISISHSRDRGLCAIGEAGDKIGCDLEWIEPRGDSFSDDYFAAEEIAFVRQTSIDFVIAVNLVWSAKESVMKALREGLRLDTRSVVIVPQFSGDSGSWNRWTGRYLPSSQIFHGWWRTEGGFIYTLVSTRISPSPKELGV